MRKTSLLFHLVRSVLLFTFLVVIQYAVAAPMLPPLNNPATDKHLTGKFIWFDLATLDIEVEKNFYHTIFGWEFQAINPADDQYTIIKNGPKNIAGMFVTEPRKGEKQGALWIGLMSVEDPVKASRLIEQDGGSVHSPPTALAQRGNFALFRDVEGALFGVLKSSSGDPPDNTAEIGEFLWMDLFSKNQKSAGDFYQKLINYQIESRVTRNGVERLILKSFGHSRASIVPLPEGVEKAGWLPYVRVDDVNATIEKIVAAGGQIKVPPQPELLDGNLAIFSDPQGGMLGIVKWPISSTDTK